MYVLSPVHTRFSLKTVCIILLQRTMFPQTAKQAQAVGETEGVVSLCMWQCSVPMRSFRLTGQPMDADWLNFVIMMYNLIKQCNSG